MADINCIKPKKCEDTPVDRDIFPPETPKFSFCAGNQTIHWDGSRLRTEKTLDVVDGEYGTVIIEDGCIVGYGLSPIATYTPPYCNPNPEPCGDGSSTTGVSVSPEAGNSLVDSALGLYARTYVQGSAGISVTGTGTLASPYIVKGTGSSGVKSVLSDNPHIVIDETIPSAPAVGLSDSGIAPGTYAGLTIDRYGLVTGYTENTDDVVSDISSGTDIEVSNIGGTYTVGHATQVAGNTTVRMGAYDVRISAGGHVESTTRMVNVEPGIYAVDGWLLTVDSYGAITSIEPDTTPAPGPSLAIIDIIDVTYNASTDTYAAQGYGPNQPTNTGGNGDFYSFSMPVYVVDVSQITIVGGGGITIELIESSPVRVQLSSATGIGANIKFVIRGPQ